MATKTDIAFSQLLLDFENPRLEEPAQNQREAVRSIAADQKIKLISLAKNIIENGLNPSVALIVMPFDDSGKYVVLDGNRRVATIKILENPNLVEKAVADNLVSQLKKLSEQYQDSPIEFVNCTVMDERSEANTWIELIHDGQQEGAGTVRWGGAERARFSERRGKKDSRLQVLDYLEKRGDLDKDTRSSVPITNFGRLIGDPYVREKLGFDLKGGKVLATLDEKEVVKGLMYIINDLASENINVGDIYYKNNRKEYIDNISSEKLPNLTKSSGEPHVLEANFSTSSEKPPNTEKDKTSGQRSKSPSSKRRKLIPSSVRFRIDNDRVNNIYHELRNLDIDSFANSVAVLFRVFIELSLDNYIVKNNIGVVKNKTTLYGSDATDATLAAKLDAVGQALQTANKLDSQQIKPVRRAAQKDSFFASTITTLHQYIHNQHFSPTPSDLRVTWDNLQPFIEAVWN